jgi:hypothetical protein
LEKAEWSPELIWTIWRREKSLFTAGIRKPDLSAHSLVAIPTFGDEAKRKISVPLRIRTLFLAV